MIREHCTTEHCTRCHHILVAGQWVKERRKQDIVYNVIICDACIEAIERSFFGQG